MAKSNASGLLTSLDSLFTTQEQRDAAKRDVVLDLPLDQIGDFPNHPFKVRQDDAMMEMMESVQLHGVLVPGLVRQLADGSYQMVSGHRRKLASELAGRDTIPCIVRDLTDDEAIIVMVDSNLQRGRILVVRHLVNFWQQNRRIVTAKSNAISASPTSSRKFWTWWMTVGSPFALRWSFLTLPNRSRARFMTPWDARTARRRLHRPLR